MFKQVSAALYEFLTRRTPDFKQVRAHLLCPVYEDTYTGIYVTFTCHGAELTPREIVRLKLILLAFLAIVSKWGVDFMLLPSCIKENYIEIRASFGTRTPTNWSTTMSVSGHVSFN
jgi:hypothetical protein